MTQATNTSLGEVKLAGDLGGNNNALAPELPASGVTPGAYVLPSITVNAKGLVTAASNGTTGSVVALIPDATTSVKGIASVNPSGNLSISSGALSIPIATSSVKGVASFSADFTVTAGHVVINTANLPVATGSVFGVVKSGTNITNTAGVLSIPDATTSVKGIASFSSSYFTVSAGAVSLASGLSISTTAQNTWTKAQSYAISVLTPGATVTPDFSLSNVFTLTAGQNFTLANPTNVVAGTTYLIIITQDATGSRVVTWGSNFKFGLNADTALSTGANKRDLVSIVALTSSVLLTTLQLGY